MIKPKVPYLQYEILEYFYMKPDSFLGEYVGYPNESKIVKEGIKKLIEKRLLTSNLELSVFGMNLVQTHIKSRYTLPVYDGLAFDDFDEYTGEQIPLINVGEVKNGDKKVFRWYKYLEDFPHDFIKSSLKKYKIDNKYFVLDPFVGSGTTLIQAKLEGYKSIGMDVNPAMIFISKNKLDWNLNTDFFKKNILQLISKFKDLSEIEKKKFFETSDLSNMPKRELNQWLSPVKQWETGAMLMLIDKFVRDNQTQDIIRFIASTAALNSSYVAFCPGTTFYPFREKPNFLEEFIKLAK